MTRPFEVQMRDTVAFGKLVNELLAIGGIEFSEIRPGLSNEKELLEQLWGKALSNAREQADKTLTNTAMKIDSVFAVSPAPFPEIQSRIFGGGTERVVVTGSAVPTPEEAGLSEYRLASVSVTQSVHVIYLISPAR